MKLLSWKRIQSEIEKGLGFHLILLLNFEDSVNSIRFFSYFLVDLLVLLVLNFCFYNHNRILNRQTSEILDFEEKLFFFGNNFQQKKTELIRLSSKKSVWGTFSFWGLLVWWDLPFTHVLLNHSSIQIHASSMSKIFSILDSSRDEH